MVLTIVPVSQSRLQNSSSHKKHRKHKRNSLISGLLCVFVADHSLVSQRHQRINFRRSHRRNQAREQGN